MLEDQPTAEVKTANCILLWSGVDWFWSPPWWWVFSLVSPAVKVAEGTALVTFDGR
jgi:hypothetical protein